MITQTLDRPVKVGRPTNEETQLRKALHEMNTLLKECHRRVVCVEQRNLLLSNALQANKLRINILSRDLSLLSRM